MHDAKRASGPSAERDAGEPAKQTQPVNRDRQAVRAVDLTDEDIAAIDRRAELDGLEGQVTGRTPFPAYHVVKAERLNGVPFHEGQLLPLWKKIQLKVNRVNWI